MEYDQQTEGCKHVQGITTKAKCLHSVSSYILQGTIHELHVCMPYIHATHDHLLIK